MIFGIGIDIIELKRIEMLVDEKPRFVEKILTKRESIAYEEKKTKRRKIEFLAGRFAAKEAFAKAFGTGIGAVKFHDLEIIPSPKGSPVLDYKHHHDFSIFLSISHSHDYAVAQVILEQPNKGSSA
ncbi:holo-[acyl-carrier protein] synthase [Natronobacillus azotifigens]|uniref:Holo-[acyl-carrier-protein] synthase n=1 Tax=Natronobacillus azotifigens TaxID=472978 RepID=A0A9J6RBT2_9BACI|nr:holo-ACP synthase [Natronobacillus azotifigens]MCZ0702689.1 holo-ACP synthase [Natronobacillus azotifigens]